jgi:hypothetical protein
MHTLNLCVALPTGIAIRSNALASCQVRGLFASSGGQPLTRL